MFDNLGWGELAILAVLGMLIFGPERLPRVAADAGRLLRELRRMATGMTAELRQELGGELDELRAAAAPRTATGERPPYDPEAT